jgi:hypothetical protein
MTIACDWGVLVILALFFVIDVAVTAVEWRRAIRTNRLLESGLARIKDGPEERGPK